MVGRHRHGHFNLMDFPLRPRPTVEPDPAIFHEIFMLQRINGRLNGIPTNLVGSVWVGKITGGINLVRLDFFNNIGYNFNIFSPNFIFFDSTSFIKRHVQKMYVCFWNTHKTASGLGFASPNNPLYVPDCFRIYIRHFFIFQKMLGFAINFIRFQIINSKLIIVVNHKINESNGLIIGNRNITRRLVSHVYVMTLVFEPLESPTHRNNIIVGMWAKNQATLAGRQCSFGAVGIVGIWLTAGPARNGML